MSISVFFYFQAFGHEDVFGLKSAIPDGCTTVDVVEGVPKDDGEGGTTQENVLYDQLPEGHPVITENHDEQVNVSSLF